MKFEKAITINIGNYQSVRIGVSDANSFADCDEALIKHVIKMGFDVDEMVKRALRWNE